MKKIITIAIIICSISSYSVIAAEQEVFTGVGIIESTSGGFKFPDGTIQITSAQNLSTDVEELQATVTTLQLAIAALQSQLSTLQTDLETNSLADASAHHDRYVDAEAVAAVGPHFSGNHGDLSNVTSGQHHDPTPVQDVSDLEATVANHDGLLQGVSRVDVYDRVEDVYYDTLLIEGMNVQITNGMGFWSNQPDILNFVNGLGNLIIGYNRFQPHHDLRTGSHNLVVGDFHNYTGYGGVIAGYRNSVSGHYSSIVGGYSNIAVGDHSTILGGQTNKAEGYNSSITGGVGHEAIGDYSSILGGFYKSAGSIYCVVGDNGVDCP